MSDFVYARHTGLVVRSRDIDPCRIERDSTSRAKAGIGGKQDNARRTQLGDENVLQGIGAERLRTNTRMYVKIRPFRAICYRKILLRGPAGDVRIAIKVDGDRVGIVVEAAIKGG